MGPRSLAPAPDRCRVLCRANVVRVAELERLGLPRSLISRRCRPGGPWRSLAPGIVVLHNGPITRDDRRAAALLLAGDGAAITGLDALRIHGIRQCPEPSGPVHVLVPSGRQRTSHGLALIERTERLPAPESGCRHPVAPVTRAAMDFVRRSTDRDVVRAVLAEVVQRERATVPELVAELAAGSGRGSALPRAVLEEVAAGVRSVAEAKARELLLSSPLLRRAIWNPRLDDAAGRFVAMPDAWLDDVGMAWEIDSYEWHLSPADHDATLDRHSAMSAHGILVVHTQPRRIRTAPAQVLDELERTYRHCTRRPRPEVHIRAERQ
ncbi:hypothetical protein [Pseudonocardia sp. KRD291]|uniref:hypothetical protein n=1 Tax=Pseudonocardia sp. KRD291 TaxID=2792007 RepID=UPI001C49CC10|nr:hypothetical protein [Pseudonocardia sp. KRD291]MBW0106202.1 hypothetical protein [Pseudonocardia sp. KRD291]